MKYDLNDEQWNAIVTKSPTLVNASAGSGKTRCLVTKIRYLLDSGESPINVCAITFTNKAANEMKSRLKQHHDITGMQISTIHSMCVRIIKEFVRYTPLKVPFSIYDDSDQATVIKTILKARGIKTDPYEYLGAISLAKSEENEVGMDEITGSIFKAYQEILVKNNACDFDDLLVYALKCVQEKDCHDRFTNLWKHILVDEFQDTSTVQYKIITSFYDPIITKTFFAVGDVNQSIYGWRGAHPENMKNFIEKYKPTVCDLVYNYRSCSEVIQHANKFLQFGKSMVAKSETTGKVSFTAFSDYEDESSKIANVIAKMGNFNETAILYRVNARSLMFEKAFALRKIPYKVVGDIPFYRRKIVKDLLSYCKASINYKDLQSLCRIVNVPKRGFGEIKQEKLLKEGRDFLLQSAEEMDTIKEFVELLDNIKTKTPLDAITTVIDKTGYRNLLQKESDYSMMDMFINVVAGFKTIDELILASTFLEEDSGKGVKLMTAHASKGLEFDRVFVVGVEEDVWPHIMSLDIEEENRLFYVACTRARKYLNISYCRTKMIRGNLIQSSPSPLFIESQR